MRKSILLVLIVLLIVPVTAFAQDDATSVPCMPENAPLTSSGYNQYAVVTVLQDGIQSENSSHVIYYRLSSVIKTETVCAVSGWMVRDYANDSPDFSSATQFMLIITSDQTVLSVSPSFFMSEFGFYPNNNDAGAIFMLTRGDNSFVISEIHTSVTQMKVIAPEISLRFEPVTQ